MIAWVVKHLFFFVEPSLEVVKLPECSVLLNGVVLSDAAS